MHERTLRAVGRLLFVFCCAVPTVFTLLTILVTWTPWYHHRALRQITASIAKDTGMRIEIENFQQPEPSRLFLQNLKVMDPETGREVARIERVAWTKVNDGISIVLEKPEIQAAELNQLWRLVHDRFLCQSICLSTNVRFAANELTISGRRSSMVLRDVDAWIEPATDSTRASIECLSSHQSGEHSFRVEVLRDRSAEKPTTTLTVETGETWLPCATIADYFNAPIADLGVDAQFAGMMRWNVAASGWWIDLSGARFEKIDLKQLSRPLAGAVSGLASVSFMRGMIHPGETIDVIADFRARDGLVDSALLGSLARDLGMSVSVDLTPPRPIPYDRLALQITLLGPNLTIDGICRGEKGYEGLPSGVVLCTNVTPLVEARELERAAIELVRLIAPNHSVTVPLSQQTSALLPLLLPPTRPSPGDQEDWQRPFPANH